jgi:hypothetical protein
VAAKWYDAWLGRWYVNYGLLDHVLRNESIDYLTLGIYLRSKLGYGQAIFST